MTPMVDDRHPAGCDGVVFIDADNDDFADIFPSDNSGSVTSPPSDYDGENYHWQWTPAESHQMTSAATGPYCYKNTVPAGPPAPADSQPAAASSCSAYLSYDAKVARSRSLLSVRVSWTQLDVKSIYACTRIYQAQAMMSIDHA